MTGPELSSFEEKQLAELIELQIDQAIEEKQLREIVKDDEEEV